MAQSANGALPYGASGNDPAIAAPQGATTAGAAEEKALPLPGWLVKLYFIFPVILYLPDAIFNYYVYSDGITQQSTSMAGQVFWRRWATKGIIRQVGSSANTCQG